MKYKLCQKVLSGPNAMNEIVEIPATAIGIPIDAKSVYYIIITYLMEVR